MLRETPVRELILYIV